MKVRLRNVAAVNPPSRRFESLNDEAEVPFLPMERLWPDYRLDLSECRSKAAVSNGYTRFESGDILLPKITPTFEADRTVVTPQLPQSVGVGTTEIHVIRPGPSVDRRYLRYHLKSHRFLMVGISELYGVAGQKRIPDEFVRDWMIDVPSIEEQRHIANFLDTETSVLDIVSWRRSCQLATLNELTQSEVDAAIVQAGNLTQVRLGYLATVQTGVTVDANRQSDRNAVTLPYLRVANVQVGRVDLSSISEITVPRTAASASRLEKGDVLMTEGGDLDKLGRGTVWRDEITPCLHQNHVFAVRPDKQRLVPDYLALLTRSSIARDYFERTGNRTTNLASTSSSKIRDFRVPLPDVDTQRKVVDQVEERLRWTTEFGDRLSRQLALLAERRQALITAAVTGQIDVSTARGVEV